MLEWKFEKKSRNHKARDPVQDSFFTNESISDDTHALVREAIQNSLDAKIDPKSGVPVRVNFSLLEHQAESEIINSYITDDAWQHFTAPDNGLSSTLTGKERCRYLVFEDFNTTGLIGDEKAYDREPRNAFYYFMRAEGQSGKEDGDRGRHGLGKYVFPKASAIRMFIMATVRSSDNRCLIAGQSLLKSHTVNETRYTPDGWLGQFENDGFQLPIENYDLFYKLSKEFNLKRGKTESGLSVIMPYVDDSISINNITQHVIAEYFYPILRKQLVVELSDDSKTTIIDSSTIHNAIEAIKPEKELDRLKPYVDLATKVISLGSPKLIELTLPSIPAAPNWNDNYLDKVSSDSINEELSKPGGLVCIQANLYVQLNNKIDSPLPSSFKIYLIKNNFDNPQKPIFIREGITIPGDRALNVRGYTGLVIIEKGPLATLLGDSENPAHTEWEKNAAKFKNKYNWGASTIDFVRLCVTKLIKLLDQNTDEIDRDVLADIFHINIPENQDGVPHKRQKRKRKEKKDSEQVNPEVDIPDIPKKPSYYKLIKLADGFALQGPEQNLPTDRRYKVRLGYAIEGSSKVTAINKHHKNDFNLKKKSGCNVVNATNVTDIEYSVNVVTFNAKNNDFSLKIDGFDSKRDLVIDVQSKELNSENI